MSVKVPANGYLIDSDYGRGWECDRGYRDVDEACVAVNVPENGYFVDSSYGSAWRCERGYEAIDEACFAVKLPENAHLDYSGNDWICDLPYQEQKDGCILP